MAVKTFGAICWDNERKQWKITHAEPHVCMRLKNVFKSIESARMAPFFFSDTPIICFDLLWFMDRYPLNISQQDKKRLLQRKKEHLKLESSLEQLLLPDYSPKILYELNPPEKARNYQLQVAEIHEVNERFLLGDDMGLGKTLSALLTLNSPKKFPCVIVVQSHLPKQWENRFIKRFTRFSSHIIKGTLPYKLPPADIYILKYSCLAGWVDFFGTGFFKYAIYDEAQEFRRRESQKYKAGAVLSSFVRYSMGLTGTPIYNYGDEIFNVLDVIKPGCLGSRDEFLTEWCSRFGQNHWKVNDPAALGTYLRSQGLFIRRTREDVGRELPPVNKLVYTVNCDEDEIDKATDIAKQLALQTTMGTFVERGQAYLELNAFVRRITGISKAKGVAAFCKIILENGLPIVLVGWHRDVYTIWLEELKEYNPVMYTGSESAKQKDDAVTKFTSGESKVFILSLRSGVGIDGLQYVCRDVVIGEQDWSPKVHDQVITRVDRDQDSNVTASVNVYYTMCDYGSDPVMMDVLGLKSSQSQGIVDPTLGIKQQHSDQTHLVKLAEYFLKMK